MKRHILQFALGAVCLVPAASSAQETERSYAPMLVDGRVWESYCYDRAGWDSYARNVFDGTVEKFGKTYHRLRPEGSESEGTLFREENGKVWRLANESGKVIKFGGANDIVEEFGPEREFLVYDLNMQPGDTIVQYSPSILGDSSDGQKFLKDVQLLKSAEIREIGGTPRIVQHFVLKETDWPDYEVVEGIGNLSQGSFGWFDIGPFEGGYHSYCKLNRVIESDGTITYEQYEPVPMIREGQVWEYHLSGAKAGVGNVERLLRFGFKGTVDRNGTEYHRLMDLDTEEAVALMREEYRQVYILLPEDKASGEKEREALLYDFGYRMLEGVESMAFKGYDWDNPFGNPYMRIQSANKMERKRFSDGGTETRAIFTQYEYGGKEFYSVVEGVGAIHGGTLFAPVEDITKYTEGDPRIVFNNLYDSEGNVLCPGAGKKVAGVEAVSGDDHADDSRMYDLNGREIRNPEPGTVYIQGGRKHVAPRR